MSVAMVLCFHAGFAWMSAGYLGVSVFFTLSGFLITGLLLDEHARSGRIALGRFSGRRVARLAPASLLCLVAVVIARSIGAFRTVPHLGRDLLGAVLQVFNWVKLGGTGSYADLFQGGQFHVTSPLEHMWSLAIEEQFYWLWPVALWAMLRRSAGRGTSVLGAVALATLVFAIAAPVTAIAFGHDAAYWATPARLAEILVGALLACWVRRRPAVPTLVGRLGPPAAVAIVALAATLPSGSGPAYDGALPLFAVLSAIVIWSVQADVRLRRMLSVGVLPTVGRISYGLYLYHWPVFVLLRERGWDLSTIPGFGLGLGITITVAVLSHRLVEMPIRTAGWRPRLVLATGVSAMASVAVLVLAVLPAAEPTIRENTALLQQAGIEPVDSVAPLVPLVTAAAATSTTSTSTPAAEDAGTAQPALAVGGAPSVVFAGNAFAPPSTTPFPTTLELPPAPNRPIRVLVVGDSTSLYFGQGLAAWALDHPGYAQVAIRWCQGCGFILDGTITSFEGERFVEQSNDLLANVVPDAVAQLQPDLVVLMTTVDDVATREWNAQEGPLDPTDLRFRARLTSAYQRVTDDVLALGVPRVAWVIPPTPTAMWMDDPGMRERARWEVQHDVIRLVAAERADQVDVVDLDGWFDASGHSDDAPWRPDGVHMTDESARLSAELFSGPAVVLSALATPLP